MPTGRPEEAEKQHRIAEERQAAGRPRTAMPRACARPVEHSMPTRFELAQDILHDIQPEPGRIRPRGLRLALPVAAGHSRVSSSGGTNASVLGGGGLAGWTIRCDGDISGTVRIWDLRGCVCPDRRSAAFRSTHSHESDFTLFSTNGRYLAIGLVNAPAAQGIEVFDTGTGRCLAQMVAPAGDGFSGQCV